mgnify:CR=1 FL=1
MYKRQYKDPVFALACDGVGTKITLALKQKNLSSIGIDLVAMCVNDLLVRGFRPKIMLDYIAVDKIDTAKLVHIITNQHVVNKCKKITIGDHIDKQVPAKLLETDSVNDLALLRTTNLKMASAETQSLLRKLSIEIIPLASGGLMRKSEVKGGEDVIVAGFPYGVRFGTEIKVTFGNVNSTKGIGDDSTQFQIQAPVQPGNSGGPIYDRYGNIVGVVVAQLNKFKMAKSIGSLPENVNFGIKASTVSQFLNTSGVITNWAKRTKPVSNEKLFDIASKQTVMVVCHRQ